MLLNGILNVLRVMSWQLAGDDKAPRPEPELLPGQVPVSDGRVADAMSIEEMEARLAPYAPQA